VYDRDVVVKLAPRTDSDLNSLRNRKVFKEAAMLSELKHVHVLEFIGLSMNSDTFFYITEYMSHRSFFETMHSEHFQITDKCVFKMLDEVTSGLIYLHGKKVLHGNLNSRSVLLNDQWQIKISGFGQERLNHRLRKLAKDRNKWTQESLYWLPPEALLGEGFDQSGDVYSLGMLMWEAMDGRTPLVGVPTKVLVERAKEGRGVQNELSLFLHRASFNSLRPILERCLCFDSAMRPTLQEVLREVRQSRILFTTGCQRDRKFA
jgi:serine/threonine protein kinase